MLRKVSSAPEKAFAIGQRLAASPGMAIDLNTLKLLLWAKKR